MSYDEIVFPTRIVHLLNERARHGYAFPARSRPAAVQTVGRRQLPPELPEDPQLALGGLGIKLDASQIPAARSLPSKE
jgi:hypothetical protein